MYERFTDRARKVMQLANQEAQRFNHEYIGTEHILLGLVKEGSGVAAHVLKNLDVDLRKIRLEVEKLVQTGPDSGTAGKLPQTPHAKKVVEYAVEEARNLGHNYVGTEHLLLGLVRVEEGVAAQVLMNLGLKLKDVRAEVLNLLGHNLSPEEGGLPPRAKSRRRKEESPELAGLPKLVLEALRDLEAQLDQLARAKEQAVADQDFEKAARLRDEEDVLKKQRATTLRTWEGKKTERAWEFDFLFPLHGADGAAVSAEKLAQLRERLTQEFGGVAELRHRVEGTWEIGGAALRGEVVALRVLAHQSGRATLFLTRLKEELKEEWGLRDILFLVRRIEVL